MQAATTAGPARPDDRRAAAAATAGASFESFYRSEADRVRRALAVSLGDAHVAGEAVDEAMTRALARWDQVSRLDSPAAWVYRVGLNWSISRWRRLRREAPLDDLDRTVGAPEPLAGGVADALRALPIDQRAVVVCRALLECSTIETAAALGIPEGTVKSRLHRGLAALRAALTDQDPGRDKEEG
jgi:RNA polymerase sigma factor (sigma-70 family)